MTGLDASTPHGALEDARAIRERVAVSEPTHLVALRVSGAGAFDAMDAVSTAALRLGDAQMRPTLLLREDGAILADAYVCRDDDAFYLLAEGAASAALVDHLHRHAPKPDVRIDDLSTTHRVLSLHGPYAWELAGEVIDQDVVGAPYLSLYGAAGVVCFRAGKTGEYGYDLLVPRDAFDALDARVGAAGAAFDARRVGVDAIDLASLENGFFCPRHAPLVTSLFERQLRWRVAFDRAFVGSAALPALDAASRRRLVHAVGDEPLTVGARLEIDGAFAGDVAHAERSPLLGKWVALASLNAALAHPELDAVAVVDGARVAIRTAAPPLVDNRSLYVSPQRHAYATRGDDAFPPIVPPP